MVTGMDVVLVYCPCDIPSSDPTSCSASLASPAPAPLGLDYWHDVACTNNIVVYRDPNIRLAQRLPDSSFTSCYAFRTLSSTSYDGEKKANLPLNFTLHFVVAVETILAFVCHNTETQQRPSRGASKTEA